MYSTFVSMSANYRFNEQHKALLDMNYLILSFFDNLRVRLSDAIYVSMAMIPFKVYFRIA